MTAALPEAVRAAKTPIEVWHQDEARVGQQGTLTSIWAEKGSRPAVLRDQRRQSASVPGALSLPHRQMTAERMASWLEGILFVVYCAGPHCNGATRSTERLANATATWQKASPTIRR